MASRSLEPDTSAPSRRLIMRRRWREPAAIAAEIERMRSLRLMRCGGAGGRCSDERRLRV